ncbi:hypothetical protein Tco_1223534 [Tanacetum coccineum]
MIKEHDQKAMTKATPRRLAYVDSDKEAPAGSLARSFSDRFSLESYCTFDTRRQTRSVSKSQRTPSKNKEPSHRRRSRRLEDRSRTKEKVGRSKSRGKRSGHQETSSDSEYEEGSEDTYEDLNSPYKRPKPTHFTQRITCFKHHLMAKLPRNIKIHGIKRRQNEGLQAFMDRFKFESSHIKGIPLVLCISAFMHGHGHPEVAKKLNEKIPKTVDEMFERVRAFIRGEVVTGLGEMVCPLQWDKGIVLLAWSGGPEKARNKGGRRETQRNMGIYTLYPRKDTFTPLIKTPKEILAMESLSFPKLPPLIRTPEKQNLNKFCDYYGDKGHNTTDCYHLKKNIEEVVASGKLSHLVKDIRQNNQRNGSQGMNNVKVINMIRGGVNRKRPFEGESFGLIDELTFPAIPQNRLTDESIVLEGRIEDHQVRRFFVKDMYPFPEEGEGLVSLMEYPYKCFL